MTEFLIGIALGLLAGIAFWLFRKSRFLPWLLPEFVGKIFGEGFNEEARNRLVQEARSQVNSIAGELVSRLQPEVQTSARNNLEAFAHGFGVDRIQVDFTDQQIDSAQVKVMMDEQPSDN